MPGRDHGDILVGRQGRLPVPVAGIRMAVDGICGRLQP
jgi:hypothetical protein